MFKRASSSSNHHDQNLPQAQAIASVLMLDQAAAQTNGQQFTSDKAIDLAASQPQQTFQHKGTSLRIQLLRTVLPVVLIPLMIASAIGYRVVQQRTEDRIQRQLEDQALLASEGTSAVLAELLQIPETIAANPLVINEALAGGEQAETSGLVDRPIAELEAQFEQTKLLRTHQTLNAYLAQIVKSAEISELLITERYGFNVAYSGSTTDFVQNDEAWWQQGKSIGQWVGPPDFDFAARGYTIEIVQAIENSSGFLGVVRAVLPARKFSLVANYLQRTGIGGSQRVQLIDAAESRVIDTYSAAGFRRDRYVIGGEAIEQLATAARVSRSQADSAQAINALAARHSLQNVTMNRLEDDSLFVSFVQNGKQYKLVTIPQTNWVAVASMDVGEISAAGRDLLMLFALTALVLSGVTTALILRLANQLSRPLWNLAGTAKQVAEGDLTVAADPRGTIETQTLAHTFNKLVVQVRSLLHQQETETRKAQIFAQITGSAAENLQALLPVFTQALDGIREILNCDRVVLYQVNLDGNSAIVAESVAPELPISSDHFLKSIWISAELLETYRQGGITITRNLAETSNSQHQFREDLAVKASLVVPVFNESDLFGLLVGHHCQTSHDWLPSEIDRFQQLASQLKLVIDRVTALKQIQEAQYIAEALLEEQRQQKEEQRQQTERLQQQVSALIRDIEGVAQGDLTVRATVTDGEIAAVAKFFNFTIERLQALVTQAKQSAHQVDHALKQNEEAVTHLADEALQQAESTTQTLDSVQQMTRSMQAVAISAQQAAEVAHTVSVTAEQGEAKMDTASQKILALQAAITGTARKVEQLSKSSQNISQVTALIREIAMQISALFDNAESSAGEKQSFTFMAVKVGQLTARTATATRSIESLLNTIGQESQQVVEAMEQVTVQMADGAELVQETRQSLGHMLDVSHQIDDLAQSISQATASQAQTSETISSLMQQVAQLSERTSNFSNQLSESLDRTVTVAQELQASVKTFNVTAH